MRSPLRGRSRWAWARRLTALTFLALLMLGSFAWFPWFKGSTTASTLLDVVPLVDPLAAAEVMVATRAWHSDVLIGAGALLLFAIVAGPVFCGWICPLGLLLDLNDAIRRRADRLLQRRSKRLPAVRPPSETKCLILGFTLGFALVARWPAFQSVSPINIVAWAVVFSMWTGLWLIAVIALVEFVSPRVWCRALCPLGALYGFVGRAGRVRIWVDSESTCNASCGRCSAQCPMGIRVSEDYLPGGQVSVDHPDCTRCGACVDACPTHMLRLGFRRRRASSLRPGSVK